MAVYAINNGKGACWHFASLGYLLFQRAGYEVYYVSGVGRNPPNQHRWLYVRFSDGWYYVDPVYADGAKMSEATLSKKYTSWDRPWEKVAS